MPATSPVRPRPRLHEHLPDPPRCLQLADLPTPVERAPWLDVPGSEAWIKRDDRSSALYGGGKVRKPSGVQSSRSTQSTTRRAASPLSIGSGSPPTARI